MPPAYRPGARALSRLALLALLASLGAGCQRQTHVPAPIVSVAASPRDEAERAFRQGDYREAERLYWSLLDPEAPAEREQALFRLALVHALPDSPLRDHDRARRYLDLLEEDFPATEFAGDARWIRGVLEAFDQLARQETARAAENARLTGETARLRVEQQALESALARLLPLPPSPEAEAGEAPPDAAGVEPPDAYGEGAEETIDALLERLRAQYPHAEVVNRLETIPALRARLDALTEAQQAQMAEIRTLTTRLAALNAELERLKEIDLRRRPPN